jgi:hypothetical protein
VLAVQSPISLPDGVAFSSVNRNDTANMGMEFRATTIMLNAMGLGVIVGNCDNGSYYPMQCNLGNMSVTYGGLVVGGATLDDETCATYWLQVDGGALIKGDTDISGNVHITGTLSYAGSDPMWETFYPVTLQEALTNIAASTPPEKRGGGSLFYNKDRQQLEFIDQNTAKVYKVSMEAIEDVTINFPN